MPEINIKVRDKCAEGEGVIICNNSDYTVVWDLDSEWEPYSTRTMRVNLADGTYQDVVFTGDNAALPVLTASGWVSVGLYAGDIHTSRAARLLALSSVLTPGGSPAAPAEDVYAQIMAKLNELSTVSPEDIAKAVEDYLAEHPAASASMRVEGGHIQFSGDGKTWENVIALADLKGPKGDTGAGMDVTGATVDQTVKIAAVDGNGVPTAWEPVDMAGGGKTWEKIGEWTVPEGSQSIQFIQQIENLNTYQQIKVFATLPSVANTAARFCVGFRFETGILWTVYNVSFNASMLTGVLASLFAYDDKFAAESCAAVIDPSNETIYGLRTNSARVLCQNLINNDAYRPSALSGIQINVQNSTTDYLDGANIVIYGVRA